MKRGVTAALLLVALVSVGSAAEMKSEFEMSLEQVEARGVVASPYRAGRRMARGLATLDDPAFALVGWAASAVPTIRAHPADSAIEHARRSFPVLKVDRSTWNGTSHPPGSAAIRDARAVRFSYLPRGPYSLTATAERFTRWPEVVDRWDGETYRRLLPVGRSGVLLEARQPEGGQV